ncbi:NPCBM/NEW2 domain-containing protein [bacterium]|nr:NPCBM/NEW2 domain-containing protein [bacterium]
MDYFQHNLRLLLILSFASLVLTQPLLENDFLSLKFSDKKNLLLYNKLAGSSLTLSLSSIKLNISEQWIGGKDLEVERVEKISPKLVKLIFKPIRNKKGAFSLVLNLSLNKNIIRKWIELAVLDSDEPLQLNEVILEELGDGSDFETIPSWWQSQPIMGKDCFFGIEFPVAFWRREEGRLILGHQPGRILRRNDKYESRKEVIGAAPTGKGREWFEEYIESLRPNPKGIHFNYNSWWSLPIIYGEKEAVSLIREFRENLFEPYGVSFDTFTIDAGWSEPKSIWQISKERFPTGFTTLVDELRRMRTKLGLWFSPSSCYPFAQDLGWARENGYEVFEANNQLYACLALGNRYQSALKRALVEIVRKYDIHQLKFDGYVPECPESNHHHLPSILSREAIAEGLIDLCLALREAQPNIWLETTCFGWEPSPWWLMFVNSVVGPYGDDSPYGRVPSPIYRHSYTSARDFYNLHDITPIPMKAKEVLGIVHQTSEPIYDDAVMTLMRGHFFISLYINPRFMKKKDWEFLASLIKWGKKNQDILGRTRIIHPEGWKVSAVDWTRDKMPRSPYGYVHWNDDNALVCVRNPFIEEKKFSFKLDLSYGISPKARNLSILRLYPIKEVLARGLNYGDEFSLLLGPYETTVLVITSGNYKESRINLPKLEIDDFVCKMEKVRVKGNKPAYGPNFTSLIGEAREYYRISSRFFLALPEGGKVVALFEYPSDDFSHPYGEARFNGRKLDVEITSSKTGWAASGPYSKTEYWSFLVVPVKGFGRFELELYAKDKASFSLWVISEGKRVDRVRLSGDLLSFPSHPHWLASHSLCLLEPRPLETVEEVEGELPYEYLEKGIYLDSLEPVEARQDWGELRRNASVQGNPMQIGSRIFSRGLGTHANSRIVYKLGGRYKRFTAYVGADKEVVGNTVVFEVWGDGRKLWESGVMTVNDGAKMVDLEISGVDILELRVGDAGDGINADHADWAEAILYE